MRSRRITENCNASTADAGPSPERYNCRSSRRKSCAIDSPRCRKGRTTWWPAWTGRWSESWVWACLPTRARGILGNIGMAVHDDWQGKGIGTALMEAALDLADNWLNLTRIELRVYTDNAAGVAFRSVKDSTPGSSRSPQNTPLTSGVPSSCRTTRNLRIL